MIKPDTGYNLSPTILDALNELSGAGNITAARFAQTIIARHGEYAGELVTGLTLLEGEESKQMQPDEWIDEIRAIFDERISPFIHGRLALVGLCLLEPEVFEQFPQATFDTLVFEIREVKKSLTDILSEQGKTIYQNLTAPKRKNAQQTKKNKAPESSEKSETNNISATDNVPNHPDNPAKTSGEDLLGRAAFARFLAKRIEAIKDNPGSYSINIHGAWGSGKSSILNFLKQELEQHQAWTVVEFNAWRHQHLRPPWWILIEHIFNRTKSKLNLWEYISELWWRFKLNRLQYLFGIIGLVWIGVFILKKVWYRDGGQDIDAIGAFMENLDKIIAAAISVWGIGAAISRWMTMKSATIAENYFQTTHDSMNTLETRFNKLVKKVLPTRLAVFIDDLDRCNSEYVVELLEGIQTLCKDAPVVFVVAADLRWLNACFEQVYENMIPFVNEPGKPLGTLFLEKTFQISTPVPGIPDDIRNSYWDNLINPSNKLSKDEDKLREEITAALKSYPDPNKAKESLKNSQYPAYLIREEIAVRLAEPDVEAHTEHLLTPFASLLEPNPRSMKRLVNAYNINRALAELTNSDIPPQELILWTILAMRWPTLATHFKEYPDDIHKTKVDHKEINHILKDKEVLHVITGGTTGTSLSKETVMKCSLLT